MRFFQVDLVQIPGIAYNPQPERKLRNPGKSTIAGNRHCWKSVLGRTRHSAHVKTAISCKFRIAMLPLCDNRCLGTSSQGSVGRHRRYRSSRDGFRYQGHDFDLFDAASHAGPMRRVQAMRPPLVKSRRTLGEASEKLGYNSKDGDTDTKSLFVLVPSGG